MVRRSSDVCLYFTQFDRKECCCVFFPFGKASSENLYSTVKKLGVVVLWRYLVAGIYHYPLPVEHKGLVWGEGGVFLSSNSHLWEAPLSLCLKTQPWVRVSNGYHCRTWCCMFVDVVIETSLKFPFFPLHIYRNVLRVRWQMEIPHVILTD